MFFRIFFFLLSSFSFKSNGFSSDFSFFECFFFEFNDSDNAIAIARSSFLKKKQI